MGSASTLMRVPAGGDTLNSTCRQPVDQIMGRLLDR
jgi:hypothetical protein